MYHQISLPLKRQTGRERALNEVPPNAMMLQPIFRFTEHTRKATVVPTAVGPLEMICMDLIQLSFARVAVLSQCMYYPKLGSQSGRMDVIEMHKHSIYLG